MKFSIITINYNNSIGLLSTIKSVIAQDFHDYEFIIIDGGSTDGSVEIIKEHANYITYWVSEKDNGVYHAMNKGVAHANGDYINFMNSGDSFYHFNTLTKVSQILSADIILGKAITCHNLIYGAHEPITLYNLCIYGFNHQATFYKKKLFTLYQYDEGLKYISDLKFTIQCLIIENCSYYVTEEIIARYDITGISSIHPEERNNERRIILGDVLPPLIADDYEFFSRLRSPLLKDIEYLSTTYYLHNIIYYLTHCLISIHQFLRKRIR